MNSLLRHIVPSIRTNPSRLLVSRFCTVPGSKEHIESLLEGKKVVVFMKGTPDEPKCGFSNAVCQIMAFHGIKDFQSHDILLPENQDLRQGIKDYANWPTIPQVYFDGEFVGGCDIMFEMHKSGELVEELQKLGIRSAVLDRPPEKPEGESS